MSPELLLFILRILIAGVLYAFLAMILLHLWKDFKESATSKQASPEAYLEKMEGEGLETTFPLDEINLIGRAIDNTLILNEGTVSGYHARLSYQRDQWWLEDLGSRNGTFVNDLPISEPIVITYGDIVGFGNIRLRLVSGLIPKEKAPSD
jgi:pSer/pThr/pTyr-binding forkhead associated (FHA) protein